MGSCTVSISIFPSLAAKNFSVKSGFQSLCCSVLQCVAVCCRLLQCVALLRLPPTFFGCRAVSNSCGTDTVTVKDADTDTDMDTDTDTDTDTDIGPVTCQQRH